MAPAAGDGLGFPAGALQTTNVNNYPNGTLFVAIFFTGTYLVSGNRVTIESHIDIQQTPGTIVLFQCDVVTGGNGAPVLTLGAISSASLVMTGAISGPRPFVKTGLGTVNPGGTVANSFEGMASLDSGLLVLNKTIGVTAIPNGINVGMNAGGPQNDMKQFTVNPTSRLNVAVGAGTDVPELANELFGALIESSAPIVVERATYANAGGQVWGAGTNATATRLP